jgi:hypothetical protein
MDNALMSSDPYQINFETMKIGFKNGIKINNGNPDEPVPDTPEGVPGGDNQKMLIIILVSVVVVVIIAALAFFFICRKKNKNLQTRLHQQEELLK